ncbi:uncharacterized protein LOC124299597 [Neodiprion virginianus]|uniref:uncharacterized protein LOC124299597 n=1 Tax=Neodiprion virginianus TaxID=2961670 RepID=UPI001EE716B0|nr:uncharacterized protein LOC124299597 [Neodiprion virginianus]
MRGEANRGRTPQSLAWLRPHSVKVLHRKGSPIGSICDGPWTALYLATGPRSSDFTIFHSVCTCTRGTSERTTSYAPETPTSQLFARVTGVSKNRTFALQAPDPFLDVRIDCHDYNNQRFDLWSERESDRSLVPESGSPRAFITYRGNMLVWPTAELRCSLCLDVLEIFLYSEAQTSVELGQHNFCRTCLTRTCVLVCMV